MSLKLTLALSPLFVKLMEWHIASYYKIENVGKIQGTFKTLAKRSQHFNNIEICCIKMV